jgi:CRP-like cAMP-binding protein
LLGSHILIAARRFPQIVRGLLARLAEQSEQEAAHLAISQLPRVPQRLMAIMWLLAEKWGYVTPGGTVLPLALTHETLGGLIGARRPTVTLGLRELSERGRLVKQDKGWLIIESSGGAIASMRQLDEPHVLRFPPPR